MQRFQNFFFRLAGLQPTENMWGSVYGGGAKQLVRVTTTTSTMQGSQSLGNSIDGGSPQPPGSPTSTTAMDVAKQRVRLHIKLLQQIGTPASVGGGLTSGKLLHFVWLGSKTIESTFRFSLQASSSASVGSPSSRKVSAPPANDDMPTYKEVFVAPKLSLVACLMKKPNLPSEKVSYDYDSSASDAVTDALDPLFLQSKLFQTLILKGDEVDAEDDYENETDNDDFWEELDSAKRAAAKKASVNPGKIVKVRNDFVPHAETVFFFYF